MKVITEIIRLENKSTRSGKMELFGKLFEIYSNDILSHYEDIFIDTF